MKNFKNCILAALLLLCILSSGGCLGDNENSSKKCPADVIENYEGLNSTYSSWELLSVSYKPEKKIAEVRKMRAYCEKLSQLVNANEGCEMAKNKKFENTGGWQKFCDTSKIQDCPSDLEQETQNLNKKITEVSKKAPTLSPAQKADEKRKLQQSCQNILSNYGTLDSCLLNDGYFKSSNMKNDCKKLETWAL